MSFKTLGNVIYFIMFELIAINQKIRYILIAK